MIMIRVLIHSEGRAWHIAMTLFDVASIQFEPDVVTYGAREHGNTYCGEGSAFPAKYMMYMQLFNLKIMTRT